MPLCLPWHDANAARRTFHFLSVLLGDAGRHWTQFKALPFQQSQFRVRCIVQQSKLYFVGAPVANNFNMFVPNNLLASSSKAYVSLPISILPGAPHFIEWDLHFVSFGVNMISCFDTVWRRRFYVSQTERLELRIEIELEPLYECWQIYAREMSELMRMMKMSKFKLRRWQMASARESRQDGSR
jgi:hypothetical protein